VSKRTITMLFARYIRSFLFPLELAAKSAARCLLASSAYILAPLSMRIWTVLRLPYRAASINAALL
jgi:hypothetical protein